MNDFSQCSPADVGNRVRVIRVANRLTQSEMAAVMGISVSNLSKIEIGARRLNDKTIRAICERFDTSAEWLVNGDEAKPSHTYPMPKPSGMILRDASTRPDIHLPDDWVEQLSGKFQGKRGVIEAGVNQYRIPLARALDPFINEFEDDLKKNPNQGGTK